MKNLTEQEIQQKIKQEMQQDMQKTYEETIDNNIDRIKTMSSTGMTRDDDIMLLDTCLKYVIFMSYVRSEKQR